MQDLFAPWRMEYILDHRKGRKCIFCPMNGVPDAKRLILHRSLHSTVMLNRYPYTYAHLMVAPHRHTSQVSKLKGEEMVDIFQNLGISMDILKRVFRPNGFNVGMNIGQVAGAGIRHHLHFHIIPRWRGDMNFMPAMAEVRVIPEHLQQTYCRLLPYFEEVERKE